MIPTHLSYSTLTTWERCQHKWLLEKVAGAPQKPAVYFAGGSAVHAMTEALDTGTAPPGAKFEDYFYPEVASLMEANDGLYWDTSKWLMGGSADKPETCEDWLTIGPKCVENWRTYDDHTEFDVEVDLTGSLPGCPVPIKAFADRIGGGDLYDLKSGKSVPKDRLQLVTYVTLLGRSIYASYFMMREAKTVKGKVTDPDPSIGERYGKVYAEMVEADRTGEYPAKREFTCKWCPVQDSCLAYAGDTKMAKENDPYYREGRPVY